VHHTPVHCNKALHDVQGVGARVTKCMGARFTKCMGARVTKGVGARVAAHYCMVHKVWVEEGYNTCNITYVCFCAKGRSGPVMDMVQLRTGPVQLFAKLEKTRTGPGHGPPKKGKKTGLNWTFKLYPAPVVELEHTPGNLLLNLAITSNSRNQAKEGVGRFQEKIKWLCIQNR
jgi:hypothetical protein